MRDVTTVWRLMVIGTLLIAPAPAIAQGDSPAALRQQIQTLQRETEALRAQLEALRAEHRAALEEIQRLQRAIADRDNRPPADQPPPQPAPSDPAPASPNGILDPLSSPDALFVAMSVSYSEAVWDAAPNPRPEAWLPDPDHVRAWTRAAAATLGGETHWLTRLRLIDAPADPQPADTQPPEPRAVVTILDPQTLQPLADEAVIPIPERFAARIENELTAARAKGQPTPLWRLRVLLRARPVFDAARQTPGPFDYPRFVGPYAGFGYTADILGVGPVSEAEARNAHTTNDVDR